MAFHDKLESMYTGYVYNNISVVNLAGVGTNNCTVAGLRATIPIM